MIGLTDSTKKKVQDVSNKSDSIFNLNNLIHSLSIENKELNLENNELNSEIRNLSRRISKQSELIENNLTGGDGYLTVELTSYVGTNKIIIEARNMSEFPIYDISIKVDDFSKRDIIFKRTNINDFISTTHYYSIGNLNPKNSRYLGNYELDPKQENIYLEFQISARNGYLHESFNIININTQNSQLAMKLVRNDKSTEMLPKVVVFIKTDKFPINEKGEPSWQL